MGEAPPAAFLSGDTMKDLKWTETAGPSYKIVLPGINDVIEQYNPPPADFCKGGDPGKEIVAVGTAVYQGVVPAAYDSHRTMCANAAWDMGPGNLWILPTMARLTYPFAPLYAVASLFKTEAVAGTKADWFVWIDDDVIVPKDLIRKLRMAADPEDRPFVAAVGYDRYPPFQPAVWEPKKTGDVTHRQHWEDSKPSGVYQVDTTGLCAAIFHRSFFDRVPQPWFSSLPPITDLDGGIESKVNPDAWMCNQCKEAGVPIYVTCDVDITHIGLPMPINRRTAPIFREALAEMREPKQVVIGLGTGRCGTKSLSRLLCLQKDSAVSHEQFPPLPWRVDAGKLKASVGTLLAREWSMVGDVGWFWLPYVGKVLQRVPDAKFVCLKRDKASCVESMLAKTGDQNQWQNHDGSKWLLNPILDQSTPKYDGVTREEAAGMMWDEYYATSEKLAEKYPDNFRVFDTDAMNTDGGVRDILEFAGFENPNVVTSIHENKRDGC